MKYYFARTLAVGFDEAVRRATDALQREGFGVLTQFDVKATTKAKLGVDFRDYRILGACNPAFAHEALQLEDKGGDDAAMQVIVQSLESGENELAAIDPVASMQAIDNPRLKAAAEQVQGKLKRIIDAL